MKNKDLFGIGAASKALEEATKEVRSLIHSFLSPTAEEAGQYLADRIRVARMVNISKALKKAKAKLDTVGVQVRPVALKLFAPILEGCSLEEDEDMIDKWANLLSAAACSDNVLPSYAKILAELTPQEARIIHGIFMLSVPPLDQKKVPVTDVRAFNSLSEEQFQAAIVNLQRLGLLEAKFREMVFLASGVPVATKDKDLVGLTLFGRQFAHVICL